MSTLRPNKPVTSRHPVLTIPAGLPAGIHRFQLVVIDETGHRSQADIVTVKVTHSSR